MCSLCFLANVLAYEKIKHSRNWNCFYTISLSSIALCQLFMAFLGNVGLVLLIKSLCVLNVAFRVHQNSELCLHENICSPCSQPTMLKRTKRFIICPYTTQIFCWKWRPAHWKQTTIFMKYVRDGAEHQPQIDPRHRESRYSRWPWQRPNNSK